VCSGWHFWKPCIGQAVSGRLDLRVLIGGAQKWAVVCLLFCISV
jgi:hypothetical protein